MSVWAGVVSGQPADSFTPTHAPLLELYCWHIVHARLLADEVANFERAWLADAVGLKRYDKLLKMAERESRAASSLATRLRMTRQVTEHRTTADRRRVSHSRSRNLWKAR